MKMKYTIATTEAYGRLMWTVREDGREVAAFDSYQAANEYVFTLVRAAGEPKSGSVGYVQLEFNFVEPKEDM